MSFETEKCKTLSTTKGKLEMRSFTTQNNDTMEAMNEDDIIIIIIIIIIIMEHHT